MMWEKGVDESYEDVILRKGIKVDKIPNAQLVEVVHANSLEKWAKFKSFESLESLQAEITRLLRMAVVSPIIYDKTAQELFPPIYNFCVYATNTDKRGKITAEAERIAEAAWWGELAPLRLKAKTDKIFNVIPDPEKYLKTAEKIKKIWGFSDSEVEAFRYFICQTRHEEHNPSMNKSLYLSSGRKKTGKTTVARALAAILNGEESVLAGAKFESTFNKELQINDHDLPFASQYNCVILDEAMPKDSKKSYGRVKSMLTSSTASYNQKYGKIMTIEAKRYYLYTSNDDISDFVQDTSERRFIQINMERVPAQISFGQIYDIWKEFAQNCQPEQDWQLWYNTFEDVDGMERKDISYFKDELLSNSSIMKAINNSIGYTITLKFFTDLLITGKSTRDERKALQNALTELIGEPNGYRWSKRLVSDKLQEAINKQEADDLISNLMTEAELEEEENHKLEHSLPF